MAANTQSKSAPVFLTGVKTVLMEIELLTFLCQSRQLLPGAEATGRNHCLTLSYKQANNSMTETILSK